MKQLCTITLLGLSCLGAFAQAPKAGKKPEDLKLLEAKFNQTFEANRVKAEQLAAAQQIKLREESSDGTVKEFYGFSENGQMIFYKTDNLGAGRTISTNKVWPGGTTGTSLTGSGMPNRLGEWDGGAVLLTHQEFGGRVVQTDGATNAIEHATHVAGTMVATGVDANAKGMAYQGTLKAYDWNNDASEMAAAGSAGMLVSNHSYGAICGWDFDEGSGNWRWWGDATLSTTEDYKFGFYTQDAKNWDDIAFNNPFYLICKSAGNDRSDNLPGGTPSHQVRNSSGTWITSTATRNKDGNTNGYDCVSTNGVAKNILTIGAVNKVGNSNSNNGWTKTSDVVMSSFSGWGPTDDGRIKPDVVACGVSVYSPTNSSNTAYATLNGTSMASPNAAGSIILAQQHHNNLKGKFMRSASLKALIIHTADEAGGAEGPDYTYGWGLINIAKAVQLITDSNYSSIQERTLANGTTYTQGLSSDGIVPLKVTICWTEQGTTPPAESLNPTTKMLLNDLDIRLTPNGGTPILPYVLNPASPASAATKGDNVRDNVEQIYIATPAAGAYTLTVSHKGTLVNSVAQNYSIIISGIVGKPAAAFSANVQNICATQTITFTDRSGGNPTGRTWYFPGGTPSTSSAATVLVTYPLAGSFPVALKVNNTLGVDSFYSANYIKVGGLSLPFSETFENSSATLGSWTIANPNNDSTWRMATIGGTTPGNRAYCMPFYNYNNINFKDGLITPPLNFKGFNNINLSFKHAYVKWNDASNPDSLKFYISTDCGNNWILLPANGAITTTGPADLNEFEPTTASQWCTTNCYSINLSAYSGMSNVKIKFEAINNHENNLYIDNVTITGSALKPVTKFGMQSTTVCAGLPVALFDSTDNNPATWQWTFTGAGTASSTVQNPSIVFTNPGTYTVQLKTTNAGGSDSLTKTNYITVLPSPNKPNIKSALNGFCVGDSTLLTTDSVNNGFQWYNNNILISGATTSSYYASLGGNYKVYLLGTNGCAASSDIKIILSGNKPDVPVITSNLSGTSFCAGGTAILTSTATAGNQWYRNGAQVSGQINKNYSTSDSGTYTVKATVSGCASDASNEITLTLKPKPITGTVTGAAAAIFNTDETYSVASTTGSTYQWTITNGTVKSGAGTNSIVVTWGVQPTGKVSVQETGTNLCKGDAQSLDITLTPKVGLDQLSFLQGIKVYPNPMHDELVITFSNNIARTATIKLVNIVGQTVSEESISGIANGLNYKLDVSKLNAGIYFVEVSSNEGTKQVKLIKK
ncbi:MAG: S8 family serine peptidase [Bacteroidota bacterium]